MEKEFMMPGWTHRCCLCERDVVSFDNPDPIRDGHENCCSECNHDLVCVARERLFRMAAEQRAAYIARLRAMSYEQLRAELT